MSFTNCSCILVFGEWIACKTSRNVRVEERYALILLVSSKCSTNRRETHSFHGLHNNVVPDDSDIQSSALPEMYLKLFLLCGTIAWVTVTQVVVH